MSIKTSTSLAVKYRPRKFSEVTEQDTIKQILGEQLATGQLKRVLLFTGPAGTGKTTNARIFANEIESCKANIIEINAADHTGVEDVRTIIDNCKSKPLQGKYKVFIIDEVHSLSVNAFNALLKLLEEPPSYCIFIMCTTDPQKIIGTILSRAYRYDFQKISHKGIVDRLNFILQQEKDAGESGCGIVSWEMAALNYISKTANGGMRDAVTLLDKVISYSKNITVEDVVKVLGVTNYDIQFDIFDCLFDKNEQQLTIKLDELYKSGKDLKLFTKNFLSFVLDLNKYITLKSFDYVSIPSTYQDRLDKYNLAYKSFLKHLLTKLIELNASMKWEVNPKTLLESSFLIEVL